mgnify:CR=1 FL=1
MPDEGRSPSRNIFPTPLQSALLAAMPTPARVTPRQAASAVADDGGSLIPTIR